MAAIPPAPPAAPPAATAPAAAPARDGDVVTVSHEGVILAIIIPASYSAPGVRFFTPGSFSQQLGYMAHPQGHEIAPHDHNPVTRLVEWTQEALVVRSGRVRLDLYAPKSRAYLESRILNPGDVVLLAHGGHGFVMLEPSEMIEIKQGPYAGERDKERFAAVPDETIVVRA